MAPIANIVELPGRPEPIHNCPQCEHWLPDGTLACPDCQTLTYGAFLGDLATQAQQSEREGQWDVARSRWEQALGWLPAETQQAERVRAHIAAIDAHLAKENDWRAKWTRRLGPLAPVVFFLAKAKSFIFVLFKAKFLFSLFAFFGLYWALFGWRFAAGFTALFIVHEFGHYIAARRRGLKADLPIFLPGFGAYVRWYHQGVSVEDLSAISLAGPVFGLASSLACGALYWGTHAQVFLALCYVGAWLNLFNLIAVFGFDGAQATYALSRMQRGLVAATCIVFFALTVNIEHGERPEWMLLLVGLSMLWRCFTNDEPERPSTRSFLVLQGLVVLLGLVVVETQMLGRF